MNKAVHSKKELLCTDSDTLVIFIHGFMGSPNQFCGLMQAVYRAGYSAVSLLLPGHGGSGIDFAKSRASMWAAHLTDELARYAHYKKIYLVGHSIGGLLAFTLSLEVQVSGIIALFTPLSLYVFNPRSYYRKLKILFAKKTTPLKQCYRSNNSIGRPFYRTLPLWPPVLLQPSKLMRQTRKLLPRVTVPALTIHSRGDETTAFKSAALFKKLLARPLHEAVLLTESFHAYYPKGERAVIEKAVLDFIARRQTINIQPNNERKESV